MLIDFCHGAIGSLIKSDKVSCDGYEVTNLVSPDPHLRRTGFLSETFIKPPVGVTVQFPCNIEICRIVVDPVIGRQKSCNIEVYTASKKLQDTYLFGGKRSESFDSSSLLFVCVGKVISDTPQLTCFEYDGFQCRSPWLPDNIPPAEQYPYRNTLRHWKRQALAYTSHVTIRVTRVTSGSTVAIKRLEVWGKPAVSLTRDLQEKLFHTFQHATQPPPSQSENITPVNNKNLPLKNKADSCASLFHENGIEIPEDFIDSITCEMMTVPMILPCGKNIDKSTLETFVDIEASWGRLPSDPFTGVVFHSDKQAVPNASLKARIDQFFLSNSEGLKHLPRRLGNKDLHESDQLKSSRLIPIHVTSTLSSKQNNQEVTTCSDNSSDSHTVVSGIKVDTSGQKLGCKQNRKRGSSCHSNSFLEGVTEIRSNSVAEPTKKFRKIVSPVSPSSNAFPTSLSEKTQFTKQISHFTQKRSNMPEEHSEQLHLSLDQALTNALGSLPSFTSFSKPVESSQPKVAASTCSICHRDLTEAGEVKYKIPCGHILCRDCMLKCNKTENSCLSCGNSFTSDKVVRVF